ncbi:MAG TPA: hypothetical protein VHZ49_08590 [Methylomirabilota bacterium]|nr:hypothetical protein [Methylomirabilota bacterium]
MIATVLALAARPGVEPPMPWTCPESHPIKGYVSHESGLRIYFMPDSPYYEEASPERCYATEDEARQDGSAPARRAEPVDARQGGEDERQG